MQINEEFFYFKEFYDFLFLLTNNSFHFLSLRRANRAETPV